MSTPDQSANGGTQKPTGDQSQDQSQNQNQNQPDDVEIKDPKAVAAKNRELLAELARIKAEKKSLQEERDAAELAKVEASGNKDAMIEAYKKQLKEADDKRLADSKRYGKKAVQDQLIAAARELGAEDPELVLRLADTSTISIDDDFQVDQAALKTALGSIKEKVPALFKKTVAAPRDGTPNGFDANGKVDISKLNREQLKAEFRKAGMRQK